MIQETDNGTAYVSLREMGGEVIATTGILGSTQPPSVVRFPLSAIEGFMAQRAATPEPSEDTPPEPSEDIARGSRVRVVSFPSRPHNYHPRNSAPLGAEGVIISSKADLDGEWVVSWDDYTIESSYALDSALEVVR